MQILSITNVKQKLTFSLVKRKFSIGCAAKAKQDEINKERKCLLGNRLDIKKDNSLRLKDS